jgi:hypothetical protein
LTVNFFNIDQFIVQQNITRALEIEGSSAHESLDAGYLTTLSNDAIPQLAAYFNDPVIPETIHDNIGAVLACRLAILDETDRAPLTSWHFSREKAIQLFNDQEALKNRYPVETDNGGLYVNLDGHRFSCDGYDWMD